MRFKSSHSPAPETSHGTPQQPDIRPLLEAGKRLAAALPLLYHETQIAHPMARTASVGVIRAQARFCIAALGGAGEGELTALRERLGQAVRAINSAPNEATARAIYDSPQVQEALWAWSAAEASVFVRNMTRNAPVDEDRHSDLVGEAALSFIREESKRQGQSKLNPFSMARTWEPARMPDPLGTLRVYLQAWCKNVVQSHLQQQAKEGLSLDAPAGGANEENGGSIGEMIEDKNAANPEAALLNQRDHQSQVAAFTKIYQRQMTGLVDDIRNLEGLTDSYSVGRRTTLQNRLAAIKEMVAPLLDRLKKTSDAISATQKDRALAPDERERQLSTLRQQFEQHLEALTVISEAQERAYEPTNSGVRSYKGKKPVADPLTSQHAYARARENAERLLPHVYRTLIQRKNTDLAQKYTSGLLTNWRLLDGIGSERDLSAAISADPHVRATANDRALFGTTMLRTMMVLRDLYTYDEKHAVIRGEDEQVPKSAKQRFIALIGEEIERDPVLRARASQLLDLLREFITGNSFRRLWDGVDHTARAAAYEWARNEKVNKRWDELSPEEASTVADEAGGFLYDNYRPFSSYSQGDAQQRVTRDLDLTPEERQKIMREEAERIVKMMRGDLPRGTWAHGEPVESPRFHDKLRAVQPLSSAGRAPNDYTTSSTLPVIRTRRFAIA